MPDTRTAAMGAEVGVGGVNACGTYRESQHRSFVKPPIQHSFAFSPTPVEQHMGQVKVASKQYPSFAHDWLAAPVGVAVAIVDEA